LDNTPINAPPSSLNAQYDDNSQKGGILTQLNDSQAPKSFVVAWLYALFLGNLGVDRFYLGKPVTAVLKFTTLGGFGLWSLYDVLMVLTGRVTLANEEPLSGFKNHSVTAWIVTFAVWFLGLVFFYLAVVSGVLIDLWNEL
jgi:TM2 domain-containing membrane protein YozV